MKLIKLIKFSLLFIAFLGLASCALFQRQIIDPEIRLERVSLDAKNFLSPRFSFDLTVVNPNSFALPIKGMNYRVSVLGVKVLSGTNNSIGRIEAFGEKQLTLEANSDLPSLLSLISRINRLADRSKIDYEAYITIEPEGLLPTIKIDKRDVFSLEGL